MKRCPITYQDLSDGQIYSLQGLKKIAPALKSLAVFSYSAAGQRLEAAKRAVKMSIQGMQPKVSARINVGQGVFEIVDAGGTFILKPQTVDYEHLPENEDLSMKLASLVGVEVPFHGLMVCEDDSYTYFIRRMDRAARGQKIPIEDFAQLSEKSRDTKYDSSMEKVVGVIEKYCSVPVVEKQKLFVRTIFNYLIGNEDMHLKNFSLISKDGLVRLAPAYDLLNTTIALHNARDEIALPLHGKKQNLTRKDLVDYFACERLGLNEKIVTQTLDHFREVIPNWRDLVETSFLPKMLKEKYWAVVHKRRAVLKL